MSCAAGDSPEGCTLSIMGKRLNNHVKGPHNELSCSSVQSLMACLQFREFEWDRCRYFDIKQSCDPLCRELLDGKVLKISGFHGG